MTAPLPNVAATTKKSSKNSKQSPKSNATTKDTSERSTTPNNFKFSRPLGKRLIRPSPAKTYTSRNTANSVFKRTNPKLHLSKVLLVPTAASPSTAHKLYNRRRKFTTHTSSGTSFSRPLESTTFTISPKSKKPVLRPTPHDFSLQLYSMYLPFY